ncbi:MAG: tRNA (N(6)-L-threonylcarbamoyladenosine(37)-C(2))-methylthiotransferase MtaB [Peptoniphilus sp.]|nr:tRNA (N(6)-L-threonylcarbamoyladenosine(37)-C(2))-methylthiotransferase MtaB [Peptoniphilus sp.]
MSKTYSIMTLGCKVNQYESKAVSEIFTDRGYEYIDHESEDADIYVINTCTVTNISDRKSRQTIRRVKKNNPDAIVAVMGCYSQISPEDVSKIEGVDIILGTTERNKIVDLCEEFEREKKQINIVRSLKGDHCFQQISAKNAEGKTRAYMKVQDGCNRFCSYCIIPYARGSIRSRDMDDAIKEARELAAAGYKEIILTGIHVGSYGYDLGDIRLIDLIEKIAEIEGIDRIRLSSVEQSIISEDFMKRAIKTNKLCDHFHLSLQSGCDKTLKAMNRKYTTDEFYEKTQLIRKYMPNAGITTDVIVGFPGETDEDFKESCDFIEKVGFSRIHIFKYSIREGTVAAKMPDQVDGNIKIQRSDALFEINEKLMEKFAKNNLGLKKSLLIEEEIEPGRFLGYTTNYIRCSVNSQENIHNQVVEVNLLETRGETLAAKIL